MKLKKYKRIVKRPEGMEHLWIWGVLIMIPMINILMGIIIIGLWALDKEVTYVEVKA